MYTLKLFVVLLFVSVVTAAIVGGYRERDANEPECIDAAEAAVAIQNAEENGNRFVANIESCSTQVVSGTNIVIRAEVCDEEDVEFKSCVKCWMKVFRNLNSEFTKVGLFTCQPEFYADEDYY